MNERQDHARARLPVRGDLDARRQARLSPPALIGGESLQPRAKVDWLTATWLPEPDEHVPAMVLDFLHQALGRHVHGVGCPGMFGYEQGVRFFAKLDDGSEHHVARLDFGGTHHSMRARVDMSGSACSIVKSWTYVEGWVRELFDVKLTRVDLAVDCLDGEFTVDDARAWYEAGEFNAGGRRPRHSCVGSWLDGEQHYGRTLNIGRRENGKALRAYEKGLQLGPGSGSAWTRFEVELRNIDRDLPLDILTRCDEYFVGAYKCLQRVLDASAERIATHQAEGELSLDRLTEFARTSYGTTINVLRAWFTADEVLSQLTRPGVPRRLEKASLGGFQPKSPPA